MLPRKVHEKNGRYYYVHRNRWHPLSRVRDGFPALYDSLLPFTGERPATYGQVMILYVAKAMRELKPASQPEYHRIITGRLQPTFGHMILGTLKPSHVAQFLELRKTEGAPVGGNRERAVLGSVCSWAMRFGWLESNPCHGVRRNRETPSRAYVTDDAYRAAFDRASPALQDLLAVALLTGWRQTDLRTLTREAITDAGLRIRQSKDGKLRLIEWSDALRFFIRRALGRSTGEHVFVSPRGLPWSVDGLQSAMRRLGPGWRFRELRKKAASDAGHNILGHDAQMLSTYVTAQRLKPLR